MWQNHPGVQLLFLASKEWEKHTEGWETPSVALSLLPAQNLGIFLLLLCSLLDFPCVSSHFPSQLQSCSADHASYLLQAVAVALGIPRNRERSLEDGLSEALNTLSSVVF